MPPRKASCGASEIAATPKKRVAANSFMLPDPIPAGQIIQDVAKNFWVLGKRIGQGGFGEIYLASDDSNRELRDTDKFVVEVEPHNNGPLFTEMHCYQRIAKPDLVDAWIKEHKLKKFGMPKYLGSGSFDHNNQKYRFMVMERFGSDLQKILEQHNKKFSLKTVYQIGLEIIDVLEFIHDNGYIHTDIKASNLLVGYQKGTGNQVFLVDYGLACRYASNGVHGEYNYDGRKAHDGTIEFTSRGAHFGARGDLEILGYNLTQWLCGKLPWEDNLTEGDFVAKHERWYMDHVDKLMDKCFPDGSPPGLQEFLSYVASLTVDEKPDYEKCRYILREGLVERGYKDDGKLVFMSATPKAISKMPKSRLNKASSEEAASSAEPDSKGRRVLDESVDMFADSDVEEVVQEVATTPLGRKKRAVATSKRVAPRSRSGSRTPASRRGSGTGLTSAAATKRQLFKLPIVGKVPLKVEKDEKLEGESDDEYFEILYFSVFDELEKENSSRRANVIRDPVRKVERKGVRDSPRRTVPKPRVAVNVPAKNGVKKSLSKDNVASSVPDLPVGCGNPTPAMMEIIARRNESTQSRTDEHTVPYRILTEEVSALQCSIQAMQDERCEVQGSQHRTQQELVQLQTKLHQLQLQEKERERDEELQRLQRVQCELGSKQQLLADIPLHNQDRASTAGLGVALFQQHLGLDIRCTASSNTTIFSFTQVLREDPERVFEVTVILNGDEYSLASEPPLPRLPHLQDTLNRTKNLAGFLGHARELFSRMG